MHPVNKLLTIMPVYSVMKQRGISMEAPGFRVPIVVSDNPHQAMELFDSKLSNNSILLSLYKKKMKELSLYSHNNSVYFCTVMHLRCIYYMACTINRFFKI